VRLEPHEEIVVRIAEEVIGPLVQEGRARLEVGKERYGAVVTIEPARADACPVSIYCESVGEINLDIGRYSLTTHIWESRDPVEFERRLVEYLTAIVEGRYEEKVRLRLDDETQAGKGRGTLHLSSGPQRFTYSYCPSFGRRSGWRRVEYEAYR
jgi:hypothetical protein